MREHRLPDALGVLRGRFGTRAQFARLHGTLVDVGCEVLQAQRVLLDRAYRIPQRFLAALVHVRQQALDRISVTGVTAKAGGSSRLTAFDLEQYAVALGARIDRRMTPMTRGP